MPSGESRQSFLGVRVVVNGTRADQQLLLFSSNLCIDGGYDLCAEVYNKGVLSPLTALIGQVCLPSSFSLLSLCDLSCSKFCAQAFSLNLLPLSLLQITATLDRIFAAEPVDVKKDTAEIAKRKLVFDLAENVITILWCLRYVPVSPCCWPGSSR